MKVKLVISKPSLKLVKDMLEVLSLPMPGDTKELVLIKARARRLRSRLGRVERAYAKSA